LKASIVSILVILQT